MTRAERNRFVILVLLLIVLVAVALLVNRLRNNNLIGADVIGVLQNQAAATFKSDDGLELTTLSSISELSVSTGVNKLTVNYNLGRRANQNSKFAVQFFPSDSGQLLTTITNQNGQAGILRVKATSIPDGTYDISFKPLYYLSQSKKSVAYANNSPATLDFTAPFKWGDIAPARPNGDAGDNEVNSADWAKFVGAWNTSDAVADYNADGEVNSADAVVLLANWGPPGEQFEPAALDVEPSAPPEL